MNMRLLILAFLVFVKASFAIHYSITTLPGYDGELRYPLETGYITVGKDASWQIFYLYAPSLNPTEDPVLFWGPGGPGCPCSTSFFYENGFLTFDYDNYPWDDSLPKLILNDEYSWTKHFNMIYMDAPPGTGYSYSNTSEGWSTSDEEFGQNWAEFCRKWFGEEHPELKNNSLFLGGDGYAGNQIAITIKQIFDGIDNKLEPFINIKGYIVSSPGADFNIDFSAQYTYANRMGLISDELYQNASIACKDQNFTQPKTEACNQTVLQMHALISNINSIAILEPNCKDVPYHLKLKSEDTNAARRFLKENYANFRKTSQAPTRWCRQYKHELLYIWANNATVQQALHAAEGRHFLWQYCNSTIEQGGAAYNQTSGVLEYHKNFTHAHDFRALILSGDHSMECTFVGTQQWIPILGVPKVVDWTPVNVSGETAGYVTKYSNGNFNLTFTTVKGAGHYGPEDRPEECYTMVKRWLNSDSLLGSD